MISLDHKKEKLSKDDLSLEVSEESIDNKRDSISYIELPDKKGNLNQSAAYSHASDTLLPKDESIKND